MIFCLVGTVGALGTSGGIRAESYGFEVLDSSWIKSRADYVLKSLIFGSWITVKLSQTVEVVALDSKHSKK